MKAALILTAIALLGSAFYLFNGEQTSQFSQDETIFKAYVQWKSDFGRNFNGSEDKYRFETFRENFLYAEEVNNDPTSTIKLAMNQFAAMSNEEYRKTMLIPAPKNRYENASYKQSTVTDVPTSINWTQKGAVTPVENQGQCGSCWAFSTKEGLEGIYQITTGKLVVLSAQQVTDCATNGNYGCGGGEPMNGYAYTQQMGIQTDASYPYVSGNTGVATQCTYNASDVVFKNTGATLVSPSMNVAAIQAAVTNQPTSIELDGGSAAFQLYSSGILNTTNCGTQLDHAILLVGYDTTGTTPYWMVKNSWGTTWGEQGYAQIAITGDGVGVCGVQQYVAYPSYSQ